MIYRREGLGYNAIQHKIDDLNKFISVYYVFSRKDR